MEDYSEGQDPGDLPSNELQSTLPDIGMTHPSQLAAWSQAHNQDDGHYGAFTTAPGGQGVVYDTQVTDIVQQAYLQSSLVQSDPDKYNPYQVDPALDKSCDMSNFRSIESDRREFDLLRAKGLEIVHTVILDEQTEKSISQQSHRHQLNTQLHHHPVDATQQMQQHQLDPPQQTHHHQVDNQQHTHHHHHQVETPQSHHHQVETPQSHHHQVDQQSHHHQHDQIETPPSHHHQVETPQSHHQVETSQSHPHQVETLQYRHMPKSVENLQLFEGQMQDSASIQSKPGMTEYGRVLLKQQQNQYIVHGAAQLMTPPQKVVTDMQMSMPVKSAEKVYPRQTAPSMHLEEEEEVELYDQDWGDHTRLLLFNLMTEHKLCDAAITTGKYTIKIHQLVLATSSERFASLLSSEQDARCATISLPINISETTLKVFVTFLYLGKVKVSLDIVKEIKLLSKIFEIHNLEHLCYGIMVKNNIQTYTGGWPKLKVSFTHDLGQKRDQGVGTEECYFRAMSEIDKSSLNKSKGKAKKVPKQQPVPKALPKAAGHRYGTRGALTPAKEPPPVEDDSVKDEDSDDAELAQMPSIKPGPKGRFRARNAAKAKRKSKGENETTEQGHTVTQNDRILESLTGNVDSCEKAVVKVSSLPVPTLRGRKQKLLHSVEMERLENNNLMSSKHEPISLPIVSEHLPNTEPVSLSMNMINGESVPMKGESTMLMNNEHVPNNYNNVGSMMSPKVSTDTFSNNQMEKSLNQSATSLSVAAGNYGNSIVKNEAQMEALTGIKKGKKGRARRSLPTHVAVRPPPKKRAKMELNRLTRENDEEYDLPMIFLSPSPSPAKELEKPSPPKIIKPKSRKRKRWANTDMTSQLASELEKMADQITEGEKQFKCELCGNEFVFPKRCVTHLLNTHKVSVDEVICNTNIRRKESSPKVCDICGYKTKDPNFYYIHYHKYFRHGVPLPQGWEPFTCDICGKECFTKFQLKDHKLIHQEATPFMCDICGQGFKSRTCLNSHVFHRHTNERKHSCPVCEKTFKTKTQRLVHMRVHTGEKPFHCPNCSYKSTTRGNMRLHLSNKHKYDAEKIKSIMVQLKTFEFALDEQKVVVNTEPQAVSQSDTSILSDTTINVTDTTLTSEAPLTLNATLDRAVNVIAAEHAMHAILLPLSTTDTTSQTITTYSVESTIPLTSITETHVTDPPTSSPALSPHRPISSNQFYLQHSPISPPPQSDSPNTQYQTSPLQQAVSPLNLQAAQVVTTTLTPVSMPQSSTPESTPTYDTASPAPSNQQAYDTAMIQTYYQHQFYPHGY